ncbi:MAG: Bax inhibitor-1/YccA family protein [Gammaproteobacteria bacterium]|jgi:modulator of FtsH protease|nr:Bax inhibitor-1/YccA family protein [Gammaproteobacteria bacterium]
METRRPLGQANVETTTTAQVTTLDPAAAKVLRNTYALLAMTVAFSAITASVAMAINMPFMGLWMLLPYFGFLFAIQKTKDSAWGLVWTFALTGFMGLTIGPILNAYLAMGGMQPVLMALGGTAVIFFGLSAYTLITKRDFSFMTGFLFVGILVAFIAAIANYFMQISALSMTISVMFLFLASGLIMWQTSAIVHGGERNYISATVTLYVMLYNIFLSLLHLIGIGND